MGRRIASFSSGQVLVGGERWSCCSALLMCCQAGLVGGGTVRIGEQGRSSEVSFGTKPKRKIFLGPTSHHIDPDASSFLPHNLSAATCLIQYASRLQTAFWVVVCSLRAPSGLTAFITTVEESFPRLTDIYPRRSAGIHATSSDTVHRRLRLLFEFNSRSSTS